MRLLADDLISFKSTLTSEVADETAFRERRSEVEQELDRLRNREVELDRIAATEGPQLVAAQDNYYNLTAQREKCDLVVKIPMRSTTESLNASVATSIALYAVDEARK